MPTPPPPPTPRRPVGRTLSTTLHRTRWGGGGFPFLLGRATPQHPCPEREHMHSTVWATTHTTSGGSQIRKKKERKGAKQCQSTPTALEPAVPVFPGDNTAEERCRRSRVALPHGPHPLPLPRILSPPSQRWVKESRNQQQEKTFMQAAFLLETRWKTPIFPADQKV